MQKLIPTVDFNPFTGFYLDLDGVFADFNGKFHELTGKWPHEVDKKVLWKTINSRDDFFASLNLMQDADALWAYCVQFDPIFLTGLPAKAGGKEQKQGWVAQKFGPQYQTIVIPKKQKQDHSGPGKVLIDDTLSNIEQWQAKGGFGFLHLDVWETISAIETLRQAHRQ